MALIESLKAGGTVFPGFSEMVTHAVIDPIIFILAKFCLKIQLLAIKNVYILPTPLPEEGTRYG